MSPVGEGLRQAVQDAVRAVRRDAVIALAAMVAGLIPLTLLVIWALGPTGWSVRGPGPLAVWGGLAIAGGALVALLLRRWVRGVDEGVVAAEAERGRGLPEGSLRGVLELGADLPPGGSAALFRRSESEMAGALAGSSARDMAGRVGERARRRRSTVLAGAVALAVVTAVAAFVTPERARGSWAPLLSPVAHLNGPTLPPVTVLPGDAEVERGGSLELDVEAPYRRSVTIQWRATGDVPRSRAVATEAGRATASLGPVSSPLRYWVTAPDGATSDTFTVHPVDPLLATDLQVEVVYPPHVGREVEVYAGEAPALRVPEGTQLRVRGGATRPLAGAVLRREDGRTRAAAVSEAGFALDWRPDVEDSGFWLLELEGSGQSAVSPALDLVVVADAPPTVRITVPEAVDTTLAASRRQPVMADAADDHGLRSAALVYRPVAAGGREGDERAIP
ncbi:MAG TPA: hypothetical protein VK966_05420, partial [Longimicrobiales bacterium]|nr:hypothetical protein [Longimicrobiales bacterium]